jgi:hypothetical protein
MHVDILMGNEQPELQVHARIPSSQRFLARLVAPPVALLALMAFQV